VRQTWLDSLRGLAVVWMVVFHATYDMRMFNLNDIDMSQGFWFAFPRLIAGTFLFCVGISLHYTHTPRINWISLRKRCLLLGFCSTIISIATFFTFRAQWIYFGTLHCILVGSLLGAFFVNHRKAAFSVMVLILASQYGLGYDIKWVSSITQRQSMDFIPIYPWFWVILLGILLAPVLERSSFLQKLPPSKRLHFLGRTSLRIYLIHQPVLFGLIWLYTKARA
jgi:uncharacterized membrane protein